MDLLLLLMVAEEVVVEEAIVEDARPVSIENSVKQRARICRLR